MQLILHLLIDYSQNAFVPGRSISDNILLAQELLAGYNQAKLPPRCTIKVDLKKAYDSVEWDFLIEVLKLFNFPPKFIGWIEQCVTTASSPYLLMVPYTASFRVPVDFDRVILCHPTYSSWLWRSGNTLLRYRVQNASDFQHHWKCLTVNPAKSQIILSRAAQQDKQQMLDLLGFQEGLTLLIKSVLCTLHAYWASVFILPKGIIKIIEARIRKFLWQGSTGRGYAKVAWEQVCKTKEEGGLGIRRITVTNQALMLKHLWKLYKWIEARFGLNGFCNIVFATPQSGHSRVHQDPGGGKKMLKLRPILKSGLIYKVRNGDSFKLWKDIWHEHGPLCISYPRGPTTTGLPIYASLSSVLLNGQWHWPLPN
ncbi:UNVERIFIED_CONTAM: putative mitochondrial protein [Sesamum calycinum]|uniref:Mitochondrial protein n=1 Tax=Sesamum calycinum TaxID=2727403 RepID=A0AAW2JLP5_9LAMI